ncbi:sigma-E factor regulatory protein RseB domain-containing protein [candidate division KSB1 bacterium]
MKSTVIKICRLLILIDAAVLLFFSTALVSQEQKHDLFFEKISKAYAHLPYQATLTFQRIEEDNITSRYAERTIVLGPEKRWYRILLPERYEDRDYVHIGDFIYTRFVDSDSIRVQRRSPFTGIFSNANEADEIVLLKSNYSIKFIREEKVEGRLADVVKISPRLRDRSSIKIWVDRDNGFIYRLEKFDIDHNKLYQACAEEVAFNPDVDESLFDVRYTGELPSAAERETYDSIAELMQDIKTPLMVLRQTPPGFILDKIIATHRPNKTSVQFYYKDGLTALSFFQHFSEDEKEDMKILWKLLDGSKQFRATIDHVTCTLQSDLPEDTMKALFDSLKLVKKEEDLGELR